MLNQRTNKQQQRAKGGNNGNSRGTPFPPEFVPTRVLKCKYRFKATAAKTSDQLTGASFLDLLCTTPTAITGFQLGNFYRISKIEVWGPMASDLAPVTVSVEWNGTTAGVYGKSVIHSDTSMGASIPAHVVSRPPVGSQVAQWLQNTSNVCKLVYPINSIVDITFQLVLRDDASVTAVTGAVAGATVGAVYVRALNSPVDNNLVPVSVATI